MMLRRCVLVLVILLFCGQLQAWSLAGHRYTSDIAYAFLSEPAKTAIFQILGQHPRFQQDFVDAMPAAVARSSERQQQMWLLSRAAYWPDLARSLPGDDQARYNRPPWHYIDGAWLYGPAGKQGNFYLARDPLPDSVGEAAADIRSEESVTNIIQSLDFNSMRFSNPALSGEERAIALCWMLHLIADLHQPLHTGALYSPELFRDGDRGGNGIVTDYGTLHARWDNAVPGENYAAVLQELLASIAAVQTNVSESDTAEWTAWMQESREIVLGDAVYDTAILNRVRAAERSGSALESIRLDDNYLSTMDRIARQRIIAAGLRMAAWLNANSR
jgi:hypothetical protein